MTPRACLFFSKVTNLLFNTSVTLCRFSRLSEILHATKCYDEENSYSYEVEPCMPIDMDGCARICHTGLGDNKIPQKPRYRPH